MTFFVVFVRGNVVGVFSSTIRARCYLRWKYGSDNWPDWKMEPYLIDALFEEELVAVRERDKADQAHLKP